MSMAEGSHESITMAYYRFLRSMRDKERRDNEDDRTYDYDRPQDLDDTTNTVLALIFFVLVPMVSILFFVYGLTHYAK